MAHIGIERLPPGDDEHDGAQHDKGMHAMVHHEGCRIGRVHCREDSRMMQDLANPRNGDGDKPDAHDRRENGADLGCAAILEREQGH